MIEKIVSLNRRFMQVNTHFLDSRPLVEALEATSVESIVLLTMNVSPPFFVTHLQQNLNQIDFTQWIPMREYPMVSRAYAIDCQTNLDSTLNLRPCPKLLDPAWDRAI